MWRKRQIGNMMNKDETLRLALETLELVSIEFVCNGAHHAKKDRHEWLDPCPIVDRYKEAITAIKAALEAKDEPVAQPEVRTGNCLRVGVCASEGHKIQPQRTWVGLTDEEISAIDWKSNETLHDFAKAVEVKLKEKNT